VLDKETFIKKICLDTKDGFLVGCDRKKTIEDIHELFIDENPDIPINTIHLITSKTSREFDATKHIKKNHFYFYSPSIIYGTDFSFENPTNQYMYITGKSVDSDMLFQMSMRTRNISKLYYYIDKGIKKCKLNYGNLDECQKDVIDKMASYNRLLSMSSYMDPDEDELVIVQNSYFNIFVNSEYELNKLKSDPKFYFEEHLKKSGFIFKKIDTKQEKQKLKSLQKEKLITKQEKELNQDEKFDTMIKGKQNLTDVIDSYTQPTDEKDQFEKLEEGTENENIMDKLLRKSKYINIQTIENLAKYKTLILDDDQCKDAIKALYFFKTDDIIKLNLKRLSDKTFKCQIMKEHVYKIYATRKLLEKHNIDIFNLNDNKKKIHIDDDDKKILKDMLYTRNKAYPTTF